MRQLAIAMLVAAVTRVAFGQGGPPMITDDPGTPGNRKWENNFAIAFEHFSRNVLTLNFGLRHEFTETYILILSMGHELRSSDQPTALIGYFGMQFVY